MSDNGLSGTTGTLENQGTAVTPAVSSASYAPAEAVGEKLIPQSEVNKIVGRTREEARQDGYARAQVELTKQQSQTTANMGGIQQLTDADIERRIDERIKEQANLQVAQKIVGDFTGKLFAAKEKYPDFESTVSQLNLSSTPQIVSWANSLDNTADVIYDIAQNPTKFAHILMLAQTAPQLAQREMQRLSDSIKTNAAAKAQPQVAEPLSQVTPGNAGTDNGSMTIRDLRKQSWMRV